MVERMIRKVVHRMNHEHLIEDEKVEEYIYAYECITEKLITVGSILVLSLIRKDLFPTILFLLFFFALRKRTGGYHMKTFSRCYLGTISTYLLISYTSNQSYRYMYEILIIVGISFIVILIFGTVNHPNMSLDNEELIQLKKSARMITGMEVLVILFLVYIKADRMLTCYLSYAVILCASLMCIAKLTKQEVKSYERT